MEATCCHGVPVNNPAYYCVECDDGLNKNPLAKGAIEVMKRTEAEDAAKSAQEIVLDNSNEIKFPDYPYIFEASIEKIIVSIDIFKSGYECKVCGGKKIIKRYCECESAGHPGKRYSNTELVEIENALGVAIAKSREEMVCPTCQGHFEDYRTEENCTACKGIGYTIILPDSSKNLPTTGVVVSIGSQVPRDKLNYKVGDRILFGPYAGNMIPTKAGLMFKIMDWNQAWCKIKGANDMSAFDFIIQED